MATIGDTALGGRGVSVIRKAVVTVMVRKMDCNDRRASKPKRMFCYQCSFQIRNTRP